MPAPYHNSTHILGGKKGDLSTIIGIFVTPFPQSPRSEAPNSELDSGFAVNLWGLLRVGIPAQAAQVGPLESGFVQ